MAAQREGAGIFPGARRGIVMAAGWGGGCNPVPNWLGSGHPKHLSGGFTRVHTINQVVITRW